MKKSINDLTDIQGKKALMRVDINVPLDADKNVTDDTRIQAILPTLNLLKEKNKPIRMLTDFPPVITSGLAYIQLHLLVSN